MKKSKRFIALLTALVLVFSTLISTTALAKVNPDVVGTDYEVAVSKLKAVGIMEGYPDGTFLPEGEITRAEFAKIAVVAMGLGDAAEASKGTTKFSDVASTHWAAGYINLAVNKGLVIGYPDGSFQPEGKMTYAEGITILVRMVGLGPVVEKEGVWPANYVGRASNEGILKGVSVASGTKAIRGLVAKMLVNALTVEQWGAKGYTNNGSVDYGKLGTTLLEDKLNITSIKEKVVDGIPQTVTSLEKGEITIDGSTYTNLTDYNADYLFGLKVNAWVNEDDEVIFAEIKTNTSDIVFDTVTASNDGTNKIDLLVKDDTFDAVADADLDVFVNYGTANLTDVATELGNNTVYGKLVFEKGKVVFAHLFSFDEIDAGLVEKVDGSEINFFDIAADDTIDLTDYEDETVVVMDAKLNEGKIADITANKVIYAFENDDDLYIIVAGEEKVGNLDRVRQKDARIAGKDFNVSGFTTVSTDSNDTLVAYDYTNAKTQDLVGETVKAVLDINGEIRHLSGDVEETSGTLYGIAVDAYTNGKYNTVEIFNAQGKTVAYNFEIKADGNAIVAADPSTGYVAVSYELNKNGEIADGTFNMTLTTDYAATDVEFHKDRNRLEIDHDGNPATPAIIYYHDNDTVFMKSEATDKEAVINWSNLVGTSANIDVIVVGTAGKAADFVYIYSNYSTLADDDFYGIVTSDAYYNGEDWITTVNVKGLGIKEYTYANATLKKGDIVNFKVSSANELITNSIDTIAGGYATTITVTAVDGDYITSLAGTYKLDANAIIYQTKAGGASLDKAISKSQIKVGDVLAIELNNEIIDVAVKVLP